MIQQILIQGWGRVRGVHDPGIMNTRVGNDEGCL